MANFKLNTVDCVFTTSNSENNLILVESINETFFDVLECSIGNNKFIFEKIDEKDGLPIVLCDIIKDDKHYVTEAVLKIGEVGEIFINESLMHKVIEQSKIISPAEKIEDNTETLTEDNSTEITNQLAESIISLYNEDKIEEKITNYTNIYQSRLDEFESKKKEFLSVIDEEFEERIKTFNNEIDTKLYDFFKLNEQDNKFIVFNEAEKLRESVSDISEKFKIELKNIKEFSKENVNRIIDNKSKEIYEKIYQHTDKLIEQNKQTISENINNLSKTFSEELNELKLLKDKIHTTDKNAIEKQNKKFKSILEHVNTKFNQLNKKVKLISESKNDEYNELLAAVNNKEVVEYKTILKEKIETAELNSVKAELLNELNGNIQNEVRGMRRYAEMSAGGGTNAVQYAKGGTMDGNLNVTGELKADTILATTLLSAGTMDINFELSGFSVTGDISANGDITGNDITAQKLVTDQYLQHNGDTDTNIEFLSNKVRVNSNFNMLMELNGATSRVGIGVSDPDETLDVSGNVQGLGGRFLGNSEAFGGLTVGGSSQFTVSHTGNVETSGELKGENLTSTDDISARDIIKSNRLNVGSGNLFVDDGTSTGNAFVKIGAYGAGNFFGKEGSVNGATFSLGVGSAGKIVEDMRIDTFALSGAGLVNKKTNPVVLVASPGANKYIIPVSIQVYKSQSGGTRIPWPTGTGATAFGIGTFQNSDNTGNFRGLTALPRTTAVIDGDWMYNRNQGPDTGTQIGSNRDLCLRGFDDISSNTSTDVIYLKVRYMVMSEDGDFKSIANLQIKDS